MNSLVKYIYSLLFIQIWSTSFAGVFHVDNRQEARIEAPPSWSETSKSVPALVPLEYMNKKDGGWQLKGRSLEEIGYCPDILFGEQRSVANCSASLIGEDLILTAAHCLEERFNRGCKDYAIVFDYALMDNAPVYSNPYFKESDDVYFCEEILYHHFADDFSEDIAIIRLDRPVKDRSPVQLSLETPQVNDELAMIGYPMGVFQKFVDQGNVTSVHENLMSFRHDLDTFSVNSGGPVFNYQSQKQVGVLVRGSSQNFKRIEGRECFGWGVADSADFGEANFLNPLPIDFDGLSTNLFPR